MELKESKELYYCNNCEKYHEKIIQFSAQSVYGVCDLCADCLIKAVLMVRQIDAPKDVIKYLLEEHLSNDKKDGVSGGFILASEKLIDWISPFLESK